MIPVRLVIIERSLAAALEALTTLIRENVYLTFEMFTPCPVGTSNYERIKRASCLYLLGRYLMELRSYLGPSSEHCSTSRQWDFLEGTPLTVRMIRMNSRYRSLLGSRNVLEVNGRLTRCLENNRDPGRIRNLDIGTELRSVTSRDIAVRRSEIKVSGTRVV